MSSSYSAIHHHRGSVRTPTSSSSARTAGNNNFNQSQQQQQYQPTTPVSKAPNVYSFDTQYSGFNNGSILPDTPPPSAASQQQQHQQQQYSYYSMPQLKSASPERRPLHRFDSPLMSAPTFATSSSMSVVPAYQPRALPLSPAASRNDNPQNRPMSPVVGSYRNHMDHVSNNPVSSNNNAHYQSRDSSLPEQQQQQQRQVAPAPRTSHPPTPTVVHAANALGMPPSSKMTTDSAVDGVLAESLANKRRAETTMSEFHCLEATHKEEAKSWNEKLRSTQASVQSLQAENGQLRRTTTEQADTVHKLRDQLTTLSRTKATAEKLKTESGSLKDKMKEMEAKLLEQETQRSTLQRRLEEKERSNSVRTQDIQSVRSRLTEKEELVTSLSEAVRERDGALAKLSVEYQAVASELGHEKQERVQETAKLENVIAESKEREMTLRRKVHDLEMELQATKHSRDEWSEKAEAAKSRCLEQARLGAAAVAGLEESSRGFYEVFFGSMVGDHCARFDALMYDAKTERAANRSKLSRLLDESDRLVEDLEYAQKVAKSELGEKELLGAEVKEVCNISTGTMRNLELLTSSASWRRAMLEMMIPDEIATAVNGIRKDVAEVVHRTNVISKRAMKKI